MAHLLAMSIPVKRDPAWSDWAKMTRARIKSAGIPVNRWQLLYYHMTILFLNEVEHRYRRSNGTIKRWKLH